MTAAQALALPPAYVTGVAILLAVGGTAGRLITEHGPRDELRYSGVFYCILLTLVISNKIRERLAVLLLGEPG